MNCRIIVFSRRKRLNLLQRNRNKKERKHHEKVVDITSRHPPDGPLRAA
jgi:hypothetical protein